MLPAERVRIAPPQLGAPPLGQVRAQSPRDPALQPGKYPGSWRPLPVGSPASDRPVPHAPHPLRVHHAVQFCQGVIGQQRTDHATISAVRRSPVASLALLAFRSPYAGGFAPAAPAAQRGWSPSPCVARLGLLVRRSAINSRRGRMPVLGRTANLSPRSSTRFATPLSRPLCSERPGLTTWPAGGDHGRTCTGWSTKPSPGAPTEIGTRPANDRQVTRKYPRVMSS
jgi:hypothetical protein